MERAVEAHPLTTDPSPSPAASRAGEPPKRKKLTTRQRVKLFEKLHGVCYLCEQQIKVGEKWEIEHEIPIELGGADDESNWKLAHIDCHKRKTAKDKGDIAKTYRRRAKHLGIKKRRGPSIPGSRDSPWKRTIDGRIVPRKRA